MSFLTNGIAGSKLIDWVIKIAKWVREFSNPIARMGSVMAVVYGIWGYGKELFAGLFARVDGLVAGSLGNANFTPLSFVNYLFPLDELLNHVVIVMGLVSLAAVVRIIKSFIPTVAS